MEKLGLWLVIIPVVSVPILYAGHLVANYERIQKNLERKSSLVVHPSVTDGNASDLGYIYSMRRETHVRDGELNLVWFVVVPATNVHYSCPYEAGYSDFKIGDSVRLIHTKSDEESDLGYILGLYDNERGQVASVWDFDLDASEIYGPPGTNQ
jgi:hypothetical protein